MFLYIFIFCVFCVPQVEAALNSRLEEGRVDKVVIGDEDIENLDRFFEKQKELTKEMDKKVVKLYRQYLFLKALLRGRPLKCKPFEKIDEITKEIRKNIDADLEKILKEGKMGSLNHVKSKKFVTFNSANTERKHLDFVVRRVKDVVGLDLMNTKLSPDDINWIVHKHTIETLIIPVFHERTHMGTETVNLRRFKNLKYLKMPSCDLATSDVFDCLPDSIECFSMTGSRFLGLLRKNINLCECFKKLWALRDFTIKDCLYLPMEVIKNLPSNINRVLISNSTMHSGAYTNGNGIVDKDVDIDLSHLSNLKELVFDRVHVGRGKTCTEGFKHRCAIHGYAGEDIDTITLKPPRGLKRFDFFVGGAHLSGVRNFGNVKRLSYLGFYVGCEKSVKILNDLFGATNPEHLSLRLCSSRFAGKILKNLLGFTNTNLQSITFLDLKGSPPGDLMKKFEKKGVKIFTKRA